MAVLAYAWTLNIPLIEDDYPNIAQALQFSSQSWIAPLLDTTFRFRTTSYWMMDFSWWLAGQSATPLSYHAISIVLHAANTFLLFTIVLRWWNQLSLAFFTAAFFAVHEGHQEAVMWFSGINELLLFFFGAASLLIWSFHDKRNTKPKNGWIALLAWGAFCLACLSKESAIILFPIFFFAAKSPGLRVDFDWKLIGFAVATALTGWAILHSRNESFRFIDGSFDPGARFERTLLASEFRLLWFWGVLALGYSVAMRTWRAVRVEVMLAFAVSSWLFLPYAFLTYMGHVPSRQTYMPSAVLAFVVGSALRHAWTNYNRRHVTAACVVIALHNIGYISLVKRPQFMSRAEPTEKFLLFARAANGPIHVACFPRPKIIAQAAAQLAHGRRPEEVVIDESVSRAGVLRYCDATQTSQKRE